MKNLISAALSALFLLAAVSSFAADGSEKAKTATVKPSCSSRSCNSTASATTQSAPTEKVVKEEGQCCPACAPCQCCPAGCCAPAKKVASVTNVSMIPAIKVTSNNNKSACQPKSGSIAD